MKKLILTLLLVAAAVSSALADKAEIRSVLRTLNEGCPTVSGQMAVERYSLSPDETELCMYFRLLPNATTDLGTLFAQKASLQQGMRSMLATPAMSGLVNMLVDENMGWRIYITSDSDTRTLDFLFPCDELRYISSSGKDPVVASNEYVATMAEIANNSGPVDLHNGLTQVSAGYNDSEYIIYFQATPTAYGYVSNNIEQQIAKNLIKNEIRANGSSNQMTLIALTTTNRDLHYRWINSETGDYLDLILPVSELRELLDEIRSNQ